MNKVKIRDMTFGELEELGYHQILCDYKLHPENKGKFWRKSICKDGKLIDIVNVYGYDFIDFSHKESLKDLIEKRIGGVMEIYVSDDIYEYLTIGKRDIHSGVDDDLVVKRLEQHEAEIRKEERLKVITELEEWANTIKYTLRQQDITTTETLDILKLEDLKQKLKGMKGE